MRLTAAEAHCASRYYLAVDVQRVLQRRQSRKNSTTNTTYAQAWRNGPGGHNTSFTHKRKSGASFRGHTVMYEQQPINTAVAMSLARDPVPDRVVRVRIVPQAVAALRDDSKRGRGRVRQRPLGNWGNQLVRIVGLDGSTVRTRLFDTITDRKTHTRALQRAGR